MSLRQYLRDSKKRLLAKALGNQDIHQGEVKLPLLPLKTAARSRRSWSGLKQSSGASLPRGRDGSRTNGQSPISPVQNRARAQTTAPFQNADQIVSTLGLGIFRRPCDRLLAPSVLVNAEPRHLWFIFSFTFCVDTYV